MNRRRKSKLWQLLGGHRLTWWLPRPRHAAAAALAVVVPTLALASGGGEETAEHGGHHGPHVANWFSVDPAVNAHAPALFWMMFTFAVFLFILKRFAGGPFANFLQMRHQTVKNAIEEARKAKAEAEAKEREYAEKLARLDDEVGKLKAEFEARGKAEIDRLEAAGKVASQRILKDAEATIQAELQQAETALKTEAARLALELAEEKIRGGIGDADEARLRKEFLDGLAN